MSLGFMLAYTVGFAMTCFRLATRSDGPIEEWAYLAAGALLAGAAVGQVLALLRHSH